MGFSLGGIINFFKNFKKKEQEHEEIKNKMAENNRKYEIRKEFIFSSGMFDFIKGVYVSHYDKYSEIKDNERGVLDTCIGILANMDELTKENLESEFKMGWECATGNLISSFTYVSMVEDLMNNKHAELVRYINEYKALNL